MKRTFKGGRRPILKLRAQGMMRRRKVLELVAQGLPVTEIAAKVGISKQCVRKHLHLALASESYPSNLTPESVEQLRTIEAEGLRAVKVKLHEALSAVKVSDAVGVARLGESYAKISERICKLLGLDAPLKILEAKMLRLEVQETDNVVKFAWDQEALETDWRTVPGLVVNGAAAVALPAETEGNNDESEHPPAAA
jgi:hypothetical protein